MRIEHTQDVELIRPLAERWLSECRAEDFGLEVSLTDIFADMRDWLKTLPSTILTAWENDHPVGFFAIFVCKSFLSSQKIALEKYWYAEPNAHRAGLVLYEEAVKWAKVNGCSHLLISASNLASGCHDKITRFCRAQGMKLFETSFLKEL